MSGSDHSVFLRELITPWDTYLHGATRVLRMEDTEYQSLCIAENPAFGRMLFLDGIVQSSLADEFIYHEALVQPAMFAAGNATSVLVLGGGEGACLREVLRWPGVERVVMVDLDPAVIDAARTLLPEWHQGAFDDPRVELRIGDAVAFLRDATEQFDVVISDMTDPVEEGPATFCFTQEYFAAVRARLRPGGVIAVQAGPWSPVELSLHARVVRTIGSVFRYAHSYPCNAPVYGRSLGFVAASDVGLRSRIVGATPPPGLRYCTPDVAQGLLASVPFIDAAVAADTTLYTDAARPATQGGAGWVG